MEKIDFPKLKKLLPNLKENISFKNYTTFKIGGPAKYFFVAKTKEDMIKAIEVAKNFNLSFFVLGGGSSLLVSDKGFDGLVIKMQAEQSRSIKTQNHNAKVKTIYAEAGIMLGELVTFSLKNSLKGLEWAVGIPGTLGGAIYNNAGVLGNSISDVIKVVTILEIRNGAVEVKNFTNKDCNFKYRDSVFKNKGNLIILSAELHFKQGDKKSIVYKQEIEKKVKDYLNHRKNTQPLNFPSAGCIFKNPESVSAGYLIDQCGLKEKKIGGAQISKKHANFIINDQNASAQDVIELIKIAKKAVKKKFGVELKEEIQYIGF